MSASSMVKRAINGSLLACLLIAAPGHAQKTEPVWGYKVRPGDRLIDIAKSYQKNPDDWKKLQQSNTVPDPKLLQPGKQINIPVADLGVVSPPVRTAPVDVGEAVHVHHLPRRQRLP